MSHKYDAVYYRASQYGSLDEAIKVNAVAHWCTTYGYSATLDSLTNVANVITSLDPDHKKDIRFVWTIDGVKFPEMSLADSYELIHQSYDGISKHPEVLTIGKKS